jgi:hypothetical protein
VGPGVLGSYLGVLWKEAFPGSTVTAQTNTTNSHDRCGRVGGWVGGWVAPGGGGGGGGGGSGGGRVVFFWCGVGGGPQRGPPGIVVLRWVGQRAGALNTGVELRLDTEVGIGNSSVCTAQLCPHHWMGYIDSSSSSSSSSKVLCVKDSGSTVALCRKQA